MKPIDLPDFTERPCGTRAKYVSARCRCLLCRAANSRYNRTRARAHARGEWNGLVPADAVRVHLSTLSKHGVGRRAVSAACDVGQSSLQEIRTGRKTHLRAETATRILAVDRTCVSDHALVNARPTWRRLERLLKEGYPALRLCRFMGYRSQGLQFGRRWVTARTALKVELLYRELLAVAMEGD